MIKRSLAAGLVLIAFAAGSGGARAQDPGQQPNVWNQPSAAIPGQSAGQQPNAWGQPQNPGQPPVAGGQAPGECGAFGGVKNEAQQRALAVRTALAKKAERQEICTLVTRFSASEESVIKFLERNKTTCGIPEQAITAAKTNHENTLKFRTAACAEQAKPRPPSLSDAIATPSVSTSSNTKTGRGTLDTLNGNPLDNK